MLYSTSVEFIHLCNSNFISDSRTSPHFPSSSPGNYFSYFSELDYFNVLCNKYNYLKCNSALPHSLHEGAMIGLALGSSMVSSLGTGLL